MKEKVVLFGASLEGDMAYKELKEKYEIICYLDNDPQKKGNTLNGLKVLSPNDLGKIDNNEKNITLIVCSDSYEEIKNQLIQLGYINIEKFSPSKREKIKKYWGNGIQLNPSLAGVYGMGSGEEFEIPYRHFWEVKHLLSIIKFDKNMNVLEIGSGNGRWAMEIGPLENKYVGIDLNRDMVEYAKSSMEEYGINNVEFYTNEITELETKLTFDIIYFSGVTQYLEDPEMIKAISKIRGISKENTIVIDRSTINANKRYINSTDSYFSIYRTPKEIENIFLKMGYKCFYKNRSYPFIRGSKWIEKIPIVNNITFSQLKKKNRIFFYIMKASSTIIEKIYPLRALDDIPTSHSHDFFIFKKG